MKSIPDSGRSMSELVRKFRVCLALAIIILAAGCSRNEFLVRFKLPQNCERTCVLVYYASDSKKGWIVESAVAVHGGKAEFKGKTRNPSLVYLLDGPGQPLVMFYVERGDKISVESSETDPLKWNITGNRISEEISKFRIDNYSALSSGDFLRINAAVAKYVKQNPDKPSSTLILLCYYDRRADESGFLAAWKSLSEEAKEAKWVELSGRSDILQHSDESAAWPKQIVLNTLSSRRDTISFARVPVLLYFSNMNSNSYQEDIAGLRAISRQYPDSASRIIADISFEPDSAARIYPVLRDSVRNVVRAWMPMGVSDDVAKRLGVMRSPFFIVVAPGGRKVYAGSDLQDASSSFGNLMNK